MTTILQPPSASPPPKASETSYGLVEEEFADNAFQLLVVCIFLNKTKGERAIPKARDLLRQYPTPEKLSKASYDDIKVFFETLGLFRRATWLIELAKQWLRTPPRAGQVWQKRRNGVVTFESEVAHFTGIGVYASDAWRIFCKDKLYGRAGRIGQEQEWKKVVPTDKELQHYLIWRWSKEGFEWNPSTGIAVSKAARIEDLNLDLGRLTIGESSTPKKPTVLGQGGSVRPLRRFPAKSKAADTAVKEAREPTVKKLVDIGVKKVEKCAVKELNIL